MDIFTSKKQIIDTINLLHIAKSSYPNLDMLKARFNKISGEIIEKLIHPEIYNILSNISELHFFKFKDALYRFSSCKNNKFVNGYPEDPVTLELITDYNELTIFKNCGYFKTTILEMNHHDILRNPITNQEIEDIDFEELLNLTKYEGSYSKLMNPETTGSLDSNEFNLNNVARKLF